jgi:meso-butanediol dehydrogenase / (S,S)-butanediol dehydrogenase / diacetyl reductase
MRLQNKVAIITGSTKAIGASIAIEFAKQGASVVVSGRGEQDGLNVVKNIESMGGKAIFVKADVTKEEELSNLVTSCVDHFGKLDILVNNAYPIDFIGGGGDGSVETLATENWDYLVKAGISGPFWACKYAIPHLRKAGGGSIINVSSMASQVGISGMAAYCTAKAGLNGLTRQVAIEYGAEKIRSNAIIIGFVLSGEMQHKVYNDPVTGPGVRAMSLSRVGRCEDVANAAIYLASDEAEFITGIEIPVDGGVLARGFVQNPSHAWESET